MNHANTTKLYREIYIDKTLKCVHGTRHRKDGIWWRRGAWVGRSALGSAFPEESLIYFKSLGTLTWTGLSNSLKSDFSVRNPWFLEGKSFHRNIQCQLSGHFRLLGILFCGLQVHISRLLQIKTMIFTCSGTYLIMCTLSPSCRDLSVMVGYSVCLL